MNPKYFNGSSVMHYRRGDRIHRKLQAASFPTQENNGLKSQPQRVSSYGGERTQTNDNVLGRR